MMALNGHTKIQLFDADTGEEVFTQTDNNLITNAISNVLNCPLDYSYKEAWATIASEITPIATKGLGGIMLWGDNIDENPNIIFPPIGIKEIGHAGQPYSGANPYRGTYNENESGRIDGGWRHVWDFGTDKANGEIKCLSLTSRGGGNGGLHVESDTSTTGVGFMTKSLCRVTYADPSIDTNERILGEIEKDVYVSFNIKTGKLNFYSNFNSDAIGLATTTGNTTVLLSSIDALDMSNLSNVQVYIDDSGIITVTGVVASTAVNIYRCTNIKVGNFEYTGSISTSPSPSHFPCVSGVYIRTFDNTTRLYSYLHYDFNGNYIATYTTSDVAYNVVSRGGREYASASSNSAAMFYGIGNADGENEYGESSGLRQLYSYRQNELSPLMLCSYSTQNPLEAHVASDLYLCQLYLGSINNLSAPVIKTKQHTMKITYDIIETTASTQE